MKYNYVTSVFICVFLFVLGKNIQPHEGKP